jgi:hypothetical protein
MKTTHKFARNALVTGALLGLGACNGMSSQDQNTAIGVPAARQTGMRVHVAGSRLPTDQSCATWH